MLDFPHGLVFALLWGHRGLVYFLTVFSWFSFPTYVLYENKLLSLFVALTHSGFVAFKPAALNE